MHKNPATPPPPPLTRACRLKAQGKRPWRTPALRPLDGQRTDGDKSAFALTEVDYGDLTTEQMFMLPGGETFTIGPPSAYSIGPS